MSTVILGTGFVILFLVSTLFVISRYERCPSDKILVVYGKVSGRSDDGSKRSARCYNGGAAFILPVRSGGPLFRTSRDSCSRIGCGWHPQ